MSPPNSGQVATRNPVGKIAEFLEGRKAEIVKVLPDGMSAERVIKMAIMTAMENDDIADKCTPVSIYRSVMQASLMGLAAGSGFGEGYFIRYKNSCTFRASYLGWAKVATRSEGVDMIRASVVHENDYIIISEQPPSAIHRPEYGKGDRGDIIGALACAYTLRRLEDGEVTHDLYDFTFVNREELDEARAQADRYKPSPAWQKWTNEMMKKVAIRRLCKMLPRNNDLSRLTRMENLADSGVVGAPDPDVLPDTDSLQNIIDAKFEEGEQGNEKQEKSKSSRLKSKISKAGDDKSKNESAEADYGTQEQRGIEF